MIPEDRCSGAGLLRAWVLLAMAEEGEEGRGGLWHCWVPARSRLGG